MALIFLPGTIIHEFAHAIMAKLLFVHVGKMELMPESYGNSLKLGSVEVGKTDIIRNFLIGVAPFIAGIAILLIILFQAFENKILGVNFLSFILLYAIFVIANTMYSSKKDMEGAVEFFLLIVAPIVVLYFVGVRIPGLTGEFLTTGSVNAFFQSAVIFLGIPLVLDLAIVLFAKIVTKR